MPIWLLNLSKSPLPIDFIAKTSSFYGKNMVFEAKHFHFSMKKVKVLTQSFWWTNLDVYWGHLAFKFLEKMISCSFYEQNKVFEVKNFHFSWRKVKVSNQSLHETNLAPFCAHLAFKSLQKTLSCWFYSKNKFTGFWVAGGQQPLIFHKFCC